LTQGDRARWEQRYGGEASALEPAAFIVRHAGRISGRVLEVACGSGRNALFLARRGLDVVAIDLALAALQQAQRSARAENLTLHLLQADLERFPLPPERYDAVVNVRYLQRSLLPQLERALKPGGILLFETFLIDQMQYGHPRNPAFLLEHGELREAFRGLDQLEYEEGLLTHERGDAYLARLLARKPRR
jgi:SAM-dependent methyltransferase